MAAKAKAGMNDTWEAVSGAGKEMMNDTASRASPGTASSSNVGGDQDVER